MCETEPCGPIIDDNPHDDYDKFKESLDKAYNDEFKITWKAIVFGFAIVVLLSCVWVPWLVGVITIGKELF
jgi:hypothetical protein